MFGTAQALQLTAVPALAPATYLVIDLETGEAPDEAIADALKAWKPPAGWKDPLKIEERRQQAFASIRADSALLDVAPILCVSTRTPNAATTISGMDHKPAPIDGVDVIDSGNEKALLLWLRTTIEAACNEQTLLIGHNVAKFDLPRLRLKYLHHGLRPPRPLIHRNFKEEQQPVFDTMWAWFRSFTSQHEDRKEDARKWPSAKEIAQHLKLPHHKDMIDGKQIPDLYRRGEYDLILRYNALDALVEELAYLYMAGIAPDLQ